MASFRKRGDKWQYIIELGNDPVTGRRKQKTKGGFRTKKLAQLAAAIEEDKIHKGTYIEESNITFKEFVPIWKKYYSKYVKTATMTMRKVAINRLNKYMENAVMRKVTKSFYTKILHNLHDEGTPKNTILIIHSTASLIFKHAAYEERIINVNPTENIDLRFLNVKDTVDDLSEINFLEKEELGNFLRTAKSRHVEEPQDFIIYLTLAYTGLRRGELIALKWTDIDFVNHTISISKTFAYGDTFKIADYKLDKPKTAESERIIDVDEYVLERLEEHKEWQENYKIDAGDRYTDSDFVFVNEKQNPGFPFSPERLYNNMCDILNSMGHKHNLTPHSLRHTHASLCIEAGIPLRDIAERLGHRDTTMLEKIYAHTTKGQREKVSKKFNDLMEKVRKETRF